MSTVLAKITVPHVDAVPADSVTNNWWFFSVGDPRLVPGGDGITVFPDWLATVLANWYKTGAPTPPVGYCSADYLWATANLKLYDMADPKPRIPFRDQAINLGAAGVDN